MPAESGCGHWLSPTLPIQRPGQPQRHSHDAAPASLAQQPKRNIFDSSEVLSFSLPGISATRESLGIVK